jgi:hypothetical protein
MVSEMQPSLAVPHTSRPSPDDNEARVFRAGWADPHVEGMRDGK